jgi:shikimate dehydrogenase
MAGEYVVLGDPVDHSRSPAIHSAAFAFLGIDARYAARRVDPSGMALAAAEMRHGDLSGANITMPHKELACRLVDRVAGEARIAGSVNTWLMEAGELVGHSTDIPGIRQAWARRSLGDGPVLILGAGGAAAAALVALADHELLVSARRPDAATRLIEALDSRAVPIPWGEGREAVLVNSTPLGMRGETLPDPVVEAATGLFEMAYGSRPTPAETTCRGGGKPVADGIDLLVAQAACSFELWFDTPAPVAVMESAARNGSSPQPGGPNQPPSQGRRMR